MSEERDRAQRPAETASRTDRARTISRGWIVLGIAIAAINGYDLIERWVREREVIWYKAILAAGGLALAVGFWLVSKQERTVKQ